MGKKQQFKTQEEEIAFLRKQVKDLKEKNDLVMSQRNDLNSCVEDLRGSLSSKKSAIEELKKRETELNTKLEAVTNRLQYVNDVYSRLKANVDFFLELSLWKRPFYLHTLK